MSSNSTSGYSSNDPRLRIGQECVRRRLATLEEVKQCLAVQKELLQKGNEVPLGNILVSRGILSIESLKEVLSATGQLALHCPDCSVTMPIQEYSSEHEYLCSLCNSELVFTSRQAGPVSSSHSDDPASGRVQKNLNHEELLDREIGGCKIIRHLASGGMGSVYEAEQLNLGRRVALKVLSNDLASDENFVKRFLQEARAAAALSHPNLIHINDAGTSQGIHFYTMEYVDGKNISEVLEEKKKLELVDALGIVKQVALALQHAHARHVVHRDIKPENIMLTPEGHVKVADLGLAKKEHGANTTTVTQAGSILGTPYYMAPEQARDFRKADARSDIYSLGVSLFKMITGHVPYNGNSAIEVMMKALEGKRPLVSQYLPQSPPELDSLLGGMMAVDPNHRFSNAEALLEGIDQVLEACKTT